MVVPQKFRKSPEVMVNYDSADLISGKGYVLYYGLDTVSGSKFLTRQSLESTDMSTQYTLSGSAALQGELDFDLRFDLPKTIDGDFFVSATYAAIQTGAATTNAFAKARLYHVSAGVETEIGAQQSGALVSQAGAGTAGYRATWEWKVNQHFKKNDILRLNMEGWGDAASNGKVTIYHDAANRTVAGLTDQHGIQANSNIVSDIPFELDI